MNGLEGLCLNTRVSALLDVLEGPRSLGRAEDSLFSKWYWENGVVSCKMVKFTS